MSRREARQILFRQFEKFYRGPQTAAVFRVRRMLEFFLEMNERAGGLDQSLEEIIVGGVVVEPEMLENIVCLIIMLIVPAAKECAVERMLRDLAGKSGLRRIGYGARVDIVAFELAHESRNPLAFVHVGLNLTELR